MWKYFNLITIIVTFLWGFSGVLIFSKKEILRKVSVLFLIISTLIIGIFIVKLWIELDRPPLRTLAETRIWYTFFMGAIGFAMYLLYKQKWLLAYASVMALVFIWVTYFNPDTLNKTLMPALLSVWFIPHVVVYIFAYAMLGMSFLTAIYGIYLCKKNKDFALVEKASFVTDQLIKVGYSFLTFGLLFGALWAKEAWGHYWTWDPKETWAFITWLGYLSYIHYRHKHKNKKVINNFYLVVISFALLLMCWFGVNYLPTAQLSVHTYTG